MPLSVSSLAPSLVHVSLADKTTTSATADLSVGAHLTKGIALRLPGNWLNQQKARLTSNQLPVLNAALGALQGREAVSDIQQDELGGRFNLVGSVYGASHVHYQREESAPDTVGFLRVDDKQGEPLLTLGQRRSAKTDSTDTGEVPGRADERSILASSRRDPQAVWQNNLYIVPFYTAHGGKAKVVGTYMNGDALRFEVKNQAGDTCAVLKRTQLDSGESAWMLPEHASIAGGNPDGSVPIGRERDLTPEELHLAKAARNRHLYYTGTDQTVVDRARSEGLSPATKTTSSIHNAIKQGMFANLSAGEIAARKEEAESHLYFTKRKEDFGGGLGARSYAKLAAGESGTPRLMRSYFKPSDHGLEPDPDSPGYAKAFRTNRKLPAGHVLPSSSAPAAVTPATELFKTEFNTSGHRESLRINTSLDSQRAAEVFRELQTPSPVDFPD